MVYHLYTPTLKLISLCQLLQGSSEREVRNQLRHHLSSQSFSRWMELYHKSRTVSRHMDKYAQCGIRHIFNARDQTFMTVLIDKELHLFLDEIFDQLYGQGSKTSLIALIDRELCK